MKKNYYLFLLLIAAALLEFYQLGTAPLKEYDEARYAANAYEMMHNGDYINLHYDGKPDTWVARPPLKAWLIIGGYQLLGYNEWGLRLSSGLAILLFFFYAFRLTNLYLSERHALICCSLLLTVKGIIGFHVGRNADMDAELIALLTAGTYYFLCYLDKEEKQMAWFAGLFFGLSFWLKTTAAFYYLPGLLLYVVVSGRWRTTLRDKHLWFGLSVFFGMIALWFVILQLYGVPFEAKEYHSHDSSWKTMLIYDTWSRFTASTFDKHPVEVNRGFFIHSIDAIFNVWNYFFYAALVFIMYHLVNKKRREAFKSSSFYSIVLMALCVTLPIALLLTFGMHKLPWYTTPSLLFLTILATYAIHELEQRIHYVTYIVYALIAFALVRHALFLNEESKETNEATFLIEQQQHWKDKTTVQYTDYLPQNMYVYFLWHGKKVYPYGKAPLDSNSVYMGEQAHFVQYEQQLKSIAVSDGERHKRTFFLAEMK